MRMPLIAALLSVSLSTAFSAQSKNHLDGIIKITEVSTKTGDILGEYRGKRVDLQCFTKNSDCVAPELRSYFLVMLGAGQGDYMDCEDDVELYSIDKEGRPGKKLGQYCAHLGN